MANDFDNKVILITGAAGNVGEVVTRRFAAGGAKLVLVGHQLPPLETLANRLAAETAVEAIDVTDEQQVDALIGRIDARFGRIDAAVHTVGGFVSGKAAYEPGLDHLERMWNLNVRPVYLVCGRVARHMLEHEIRGHIVAVAARSAQRGSAKSGPYSASKAAALRILESLALEVRDQGIHVNAVSPSTIDTPQNRADMPKADFSKWVTPEQLADTIVWLCSDGAAAIYGANVEVAGRA